jgi:hypothetical protein
MYHLTPCATAGKSKKA